MNQVLFGDIFINIEQLLQPKDLYVLSQSCKKYNQMIIIKKSIICEINKRLRHILGNEYEKFIESMVNADAAIVGSFITQCLLGETMKHMIDL